jgi:hypothetical protein
MNTYLTEAKKLLSRAIDGNTKDLKKKIELLETTVTHTLERPVWQKGGDIFHSLDDNSVNLNKNEKANISKLNKTIQSCMTMPDKTQRVAHFLANARLQEKQLPLEKQAELALRIACITSSASILDNQGKPAHKAMYMVTKHLGVHKAIHSVIRSIENIFVSERKGKKAILTTLATTNYPDFLTHLYTTNNFNLLGYYTILIRVLNDMEPFDAEFVNAVIFRIADQEKSITDNYPVTLPEDKMHRLKLRVNMYDHFFKRLIDFDTAGYKVHVDAVYTDEEDVADFYLLAQEYQKAIYNNTQSTQEIITKLALFPFSRYIKNTLQNIVEMNVTTKQPEDLESILNYFTDLGYTRITPRASNIVNVNFNDGKKAVITAILSMLKKTITRYNVGRADVLLQAIELKLTEYLFCSIYPISPNDVESLYRHIYVVIRTALIDINKEYGIDVQNMDHLVLFALKDLKFENWKEFIIDNGKKEKEREREKEKERDREYRDNRDRARQEASQRADFLRSQRNLPKIIIPTFKGTLEGFKHDVLQLRDYIKYVFREYDTGLNPEIYPDSGINVLLKKYDTHIETVLKKNYYIKTTPTIRKLLYMITHPDKNNDVVLVQKLTNNDVVRMLQDAYKHELINIVINGKNGVVKGGANKKKQPLTEYQKFVRDFSKSATGKAIPGKNLFKRCAAEWEKKKNRGR